MLLQCPECELNVSDKAITCPHCGYPFQIDVAIKKKKPPNKNKRRRLPNGFGSITEIKNKNLRNSFRVEITVGKTSTGTPIRKLLKPISFFSTYNDAYSALVEYNKNPYDLDDDLTIFELYKRWSEEYFKTLSNKSSIRSITAAWNYCNSIYDMRVKEIRARHLKGCIDNGTYKNKNGEVKTPSPTTKTKMKSLMNLMFDYAVEYELTDRNYARTFNISDDILEEKEEKKQPHIPFTDEERQILFDNVGKFPYADLIIIQSYSGWRPQELGLIKLSDVDLDNWTFKGGMKTKAGKNRTVPIHSKIKELVKVRYEEAVSLNSEYLFNAVDSTKNGIFLTYDKYNARFNKVISYFKLNPDHRPHDPRKDFITRAKKAGVDEYSVKILAGHNIDDVTEKVYTQRDIEWLRKDIELIP